MQSMQDSIEEELVAWCSSRQMIFEIVEIQRLREREREKEKEKERERERERELGRDRDESPTTPHTPTHSRIEAS